MSIETYFPTAKGGFLDIFLGGNNQNAGTISQSQLNISTKGLKSLSNPALCSSPLQTSRGEKESRSLDRVLKNEYGTPFSRKELAQFLEADGQDRLFLFLKAVEEYVKYSGPLFPHYTLENQREARRFTQKKVENNSLLRKIGNNQRISVTAASGFELPKGPALLTTHNYVNLVSYLQEMGSKIGNTYILNLENILDLPESVIKTFQEVYDRAELHPKIFEQAYFYIFDRLEQGLFAEFLKQRRKHASEVPGYTVIDIALKKPQSPYSYCEFHDFLSKKGAEKELEFLAVVIEYLADTEEIYPKVLIKVSSFKDFSTVSPDESPYASTFDQIIGNPLVSNSFALIPLNEVKKPDAMSLEEFQEKSNNLTARFKNIIETYISESATSPIIILPGIQKSILKYHKEGSCHPDLLYQPFEMISNIIRIQSLKEFLESQHQVAKMNAFLESTIPSYTSTELLNDEALPPYSKRDFLAFIHESDRAQYYLDFLNDLKEHEKNCKIFLSHTCNMKLDYRPAEDELEGFLQEVKTDVSMEPTKPDGMSDSEFIAIKNILLNNAKFIFESYLYYDAKKRLLDLENESIDCISNYLAYDNFNPLIFMKEKLAGESYFEKNIVLQFLKEKYEERLEKGIANKFSKKIFTKMEKVLIDEAEGSFGYNSFSEYCVKQEAADGLELIRAILKYVQNAHSIFSDSIDGPPKAPKQPSTMRDSEYLSHCLSLKAQCKLIFQKFIGFVNVALPPPVLKPLPSKVQSEKNRKNSIDASMEDQGPRGQTVVEFLSNLERCQPTTETLSKNDANHMKIPEVIRKPLMAARESEIYHPNIFTRVYDYFYTQIENKVWNGYEKYIDPAGIYGSIQEEDRRITIRQLALDELPSPFSYQDYSNYLQTQLCRETIEFLRDCYLCQIVAEPLYGIRIIKQNSNNVQTLADRYIPSPLKVATNFEGSVLAHQKNFKAIVEKYINPGSPSEVNLPVKCRKPFLKLYEEGFSHPEMLNELIEHISDMLKVNNFHKFLKQAAEVAANAAKKTNIYDIPIRHLVLNVLPSPFSTKDFMIYLKNESCPEGLEFLLTIVAYHAYASPFYPDITHDRESENFKQIKLRCKLIAETYMYPDSPKVVNALTDSMKKKLRIELVKENFHPEIWKTSFEAVALYLTKEKMPKFLKRAGKS